MSRTFITLLGLFIVALLVFFCVRRHAPAIQGDIHSRTSLALSTAPTQWAKVSVDGRNILLTGVAPSSLLRNKAGEIAQSVLGVMAVDNQITIAESPSISIIQPDSDPLLVSPYLSSFTKKNIDPPSIELSGFVPSEAERLALIRHAEQIVGVGNVTDLLEIANGAPSGWLQASKVAITKLGLFNSGVVKLTDTQINLSGEVNTGVKNTIEAGLQTLLPANFNVNSNLTVPVAIIVEQAISSCSNTFNVQVPDSIIHFLTDSVSLEQATSAVITNVLDFSVSCPNSIVQVAGYTDARGSRVYNMNLSKYRAQAVVDLLIAKGMSANRLAVVGFGEDMPLADNSTDAGQAKNRRIELKYLQEGE